MNQETKHFVTFYSPGTFFNEERRVEIKEWDTAEAVRLAGTVVERYGARPYAFIFSTVIVVSDVSDGCGGTMPESEKVKCTSGRHYINGKVLTLDDVEKGSILESNMRCDGWKEVVQTNNGYQHTGIFSGEDVIVDSDGTVIRRAMP